MKSRTSSKNLQSNRCHVRPWLFPKIPFALFVLALLGTAALGGCAHKKAPPPPPQTPLAKKFETKCREEYSLHVVTRLVGRTFWVYLPTENPIVDFSAQKPTPKSQKKTGKYDLLYINGNFENKSFDFQYDVVPKTKPDLQDNGVGNQYTDYFNKASNNLFAAVTETMLDPDTPVDFVAMVITDVKKGIEIHNIFYLDDYRKVTVGALPYDEFNKRILQEFKGNTAFIGDEVGQHLKYNDIQMPDFLTKQIINRIRFQFTQSDFPPGDDYENVIIGIIADTLRYYDFASFQDVRTDNLRKKKKMIFTPEELKYFGKDKPSDKNTKSKGKLIHIIFKNGQPQ